MGWLYFYIIKWKKRTILKIGDPALVNQLTNDYSPSKFLVKFILFAIAASLVIIAMANPRSPKGSTPVKRTGIDVMIALDVSKSMLAQDIKPDRLERAKQILSKLIDRLHNDRIGIVVFAGRAYLQMPLTTDHVAAKMYLSSASPEVVPTQGTVIGDALKMCYAAFNSREKKYKAIILISDGEDHDENAVTLTKAMAEEGVMINTIGIGSPEGALIADTRNNDVKRDERGNPVVTKLNEAELRDIAEKGNGIYQRFTNTDEVIMNLENQLKSMGQKAITENSLINYKSFFPWLLSFSFIILLIEFLISEKRGKGMARRLKGRKSMGNIAILAGIIFIPSITTAQKALIGKGNEAYNKNNYTLAIEEYKKAIEKDPSNPKAPYNMGNALYKEGKADEAVVSYESAIHNSKESQEKSAAFYNKGVVLQNNKKLPECIEAYKEALRLNPADEDARFNLQKALQQQKKQEQQSKKNNDKKDQKNKPNSGDQKKNEENKDQNDLPKPQPSKMTKKEAEEKLKALLQQEKKLQDKLRKVKAESPEKPEKDW